CHYTVDSARAPFISEYLYAPLTLYYKEAIKTLRQLRCMYTSSSSHWEGSRSMGILEVWRYAISSIANSSSLLWPMHAIMLAHLMT
ncbi:dead deah box helicase domain-containing protein, partial [Cystoisospora suis]